MYHANNDWKISIKVDKETLNAEVYRVFKDDERPDEKLVPTGTKQFSKERRKIDYFQIGNFCISLGSFIMKIVEMCG